MNQTATYETEAFSTKNMNFIMVLMLAYGLFALMGGHAWVTGNLFDFYNEGLANLNRTMARVLGIVLTSISLTTPLTSNLYSPRLVKVFLTHPIIVSGLSCLVFGQVCMVLALLLGAHHPAFPLFSGLATIIAFITLAGVLPYLFFVSYLLRPSFFMKLLIRRSFKQMEKLKEKPEEQQDVTQIFDTIDVIANIASTGMRRGDKQLLLLCVRSLHEQLISIMTLFRERKDFSGIRPIFVSGLVREGRDYLGEKKIWPEAYLLAHLVGLMELTSSKQHQLLAETAHLIVTSAKIAAEEEREDLLELHILVLNTLMRMAVENGDVRKFQNLSYHYCMLIESLTWSPQWQEEVVKHMIHYGKIAYRHHLKGCIETIYYDLGDLVLSLAEIDEHIGSEFVEHHVASAWLNGLTLEDEHLHGVIWRSVIHVYWEAKAKELLFICNHLEEICLFDEHKHKNQLEIILTHNRPLHWEFNDRLLRMAYLSPAAEKLAWTFVESMEDEKMMVERDLIDEED